MSAAPHANGGHAASDDHGGHDAAAHGTLKSYLIGFVLSVVLTVIPFWLVMGKVIAQPNIVATIILGLAAIQMVVHVIYFLHMNAKSEGGWNLLALIFTLIIVVIVLTGSIWVMYHMDHNMMPVSAAQMRNMP